MIRYIDLRAAAAVTIEAAGTNAGFTGEYLEPLDVDPKGVHQFVREWVKGRMDDGLIEQLANDEPHAVYKAFLESGIAIGLAARQASDATDASDGGSTQKAVITLEDVEGKESESLTMSVELEPGVAVSQMDGTLAHSASLRAARDIAEFIRGRAEGVTVLGAVITDDDEGGGERWKL